MVLYAFFVMCMLIPCVGHGASLYDTSEQRELVSGLQSDADLIHSRDIEKIRNFIKNEDADFITNILSLPVEEQVSLMRSWLAKRAFKYIYDKYMAEIKSQSEKTGRKIKTDTYKEDANTHAIINSNYWLDRGTLDDEECKQDLPNRRACDYPDGFEEYNISYTRIIAKDQNSAVEELSIEKDSIAENSRQFILVSVTVTPGNFVDVKNYNYTISLSGSTETYEERHKLRNQEAADIRAGKYRQVTKGYVINDNSRKWDSDWLPDASVTDVLIDYSYGYSK